MNLDNSKIIPKEENLKYLYKYRSIDESNLETDYALEALFNSFAVLSRGN
jgi:hypothetical protein